MKVAKEEDRGGVGVKYNYLPHHPSIYSILTDSDDMVSKQVRIEVPVDGQTISKYSLVGRTVDYDVACKSLLYH